MTPETAKAIADFLLNSLENEFPTTKKLIAALPADKLTWQPNPKGMKAGELAWHIVSSELGLLAGIAEKAFTFTPGPPEPATTGEMLSIYEQKFPELLAKIRALSPEALATPTKFFVFDFPLFVYIQFVITHGVHHRGQLSTYLRAMGAKVPSIYGGSADEPFEMPVNA
jgi:uncharacterized damage-inducible protein DinB